MRKINFRGSEAVVTSDFPPGQTEYYFYGIRHSETDWDDPQTIEELVVVNKWGFIGFTEPLDPDLFDENKCIPIWEGEKGLLREAMYLYFRERRGGDNNAL